MNNREKTSNKAAAQTSYENRCSLEKLTTENRKTPIKNTLRVDLGAREGMVDNFCFKIIEIVLGVYSNSVCVCVCVCVCECVHNINFVSA